MSEPSRRVLLVGLLALALAYAWPMQVPGYNQNAHYALVRALADGKPYVDRALGEIGELSTGDIAHHGGHVYAVKAPGLAFASLPAFVVLDGAGMRTTGDPTRIEWALHLIGSVLPSLLVVVLVYLLAERVEPGLGPLTALLVAIATLVLPFSTLFFAHALSTVLGFAAFALLWHERTGAARPLLLATGGLIAGLAITVEYQFWLLAMILAVYALSRGDLLRRLGSYSAGVAAGVAPVFAFHWWAFGSPLHTPYQDYWREHGISAGTVAAPSLASLREMLFSSMGVLTLMPVVALGLVGCWLLYRRGLRAEALVIGAVAVLYPVYFSRLGPSGGLGPPRYLTVIVPFLAVPLAATLRRLPLTTLTLGAVSAFQLVVMTPTGPLAAYDGEWLSRLVHRQFIEALPSLIDITGWYAALPFFVAVAVAVGVAVWASPAFSLSPFEAGIALVGLAGWALVALQATSVYGRPPSNAYVGAIACVLGAIVLVVAVFGRPGGLRAPTVAESRE